MRKIGSSGSLGVWLGGNHVGRLSRESAGAIFFQYDESWISQADAFPVSLSLPLQEQRYSGDPVLAVFDNLLPDNESIRRRLAERMKAGGRDTFSLLEALGRDCVGALQFLPKDETPADNPGVQAEPLSLSDVSILLKNLHAMPLGVAADQDFRISVAGAQEKTALLYLHGWHRPKGTTATTHILKPQIGKLPNGLDMSQSAENEHFCMRLMANLGLPVANTEVLDFEDVRALCVERFDRLWTDKGVLLRRPQEDCCQALGVSPAIKYEADGGPGVSAILKLLSGSDNRTEDQRTFLKAQICFWLISATDGHAKNFSIYMGRQGRFRLTPLYDIMSTEPLYTRKQISKNQMKMAMCFGNNRRYRLDTITARHFTQSAEASQLSRAIVEDIISDLHQNADTAIHKTLENLATDFAPAVVSSITNTLAKKLKLLR